MRLRFFVIAVVFCFGCSGSRTWTKADTVRQAAVVALQVADWHQTKRLATERTPTVLVEKPDGSSTTYFSRYRHEEWNPILGERPSRAKIDLYFVGSIVGNAAVSCLLPSNWRGAWQYISIGVEAGFVAHNIEIGVKW